MATSFPTYPAATFEQAVELAIFSSNQLHNIINADPLSNVETEEGDIPSIRKALIDNLYFKTPAISWSEGTSVTVFNQLYTFSGGTTGTALWYAPTATVSSPVTMGSSPEDDANWKVYGWDTYSKSELSSTSGASYIGTSSGSTLQTELDSADLFSGSYEDSIITITSYNRWITYNGERWVVNPSSSLPITTTGTDSTSWENDKGNFSVVGSSDLTEVLFSTSQYIDWETPEAYGAVGDGVTDDSAAILSALQTGKKVKFSKGKSYLAEGVTYTGKVYVEATGATFLGDTFSIILTDSGGSYWNGGLFKPKTTPWTVVYNEDFTVKEQGYLGYGRMPFQDDTNVDSQYYYQEICSGLAFKSSSSTAEDGVFVSNVEFDYGALLIAGFKNIIIDNVKARGGQSAAAINITNDCVDLYNASYLTSGSTSSTNQNPFRWARGANHLINNCYLYESRANGLSITGSDNCVISNTILRDNAESGIKTGQYTVRDWTDTGIVNTNLTISNCHAYGQWYDGFDLNACFGSGLVSAPVTSGVIFTDCTSTGNRKTGATASGNNGLKVKNFVSRDNGTDGFTGIVCRNAHVNAYCSGFGSLIGRKYGIYLTGVDNKIVDSNVYIDDTNKNGNYNYYMSQDSTYSLTKLEFTGHFINNEQNPTWSLRSTFGADVYIDSNFSNPTSGINNRIVGKMPTVNGSPLSLAYVAGHMLVGSHSELGNSVQALKKPGPNGIWYRIGSMAASPSANGPIYQSMNWYDKAGTNTRDDSTYYGSRFAHGHTGFGFNFFDGTNVTQPIGVDTLGLTAGTNNTFNIGSATVKFNNGYFNALGTSAAPTGNIYTSASPTVVSDEDRKTDISELSDIEITCALACAKLYRRYKLTSAIEEKGETSARYHIGTIAQLVTQCFTDNGLDWTKYGIITYEEWEAQDAITNSDGTILTEAVEAGHIYMMRYEEFNSFINAGMQARLDQLEALLISTT